ncbi:MAG: arsenic resistance protein [Pseudomonadota bacterium]
MLVKSIHHFAEFMSGRGTVIVLIASIAMGIILGFTFPNIEEILSNQIDITILLLVFLLLFDVRIKNVLSSLQNLPFIGIVLVTNFIIIPLIGYGIASLFLSEYPLFFIGLVIYFMAPCTDWFLGFTKLAKGNTALGAALIPLNMISQLLLYPFYLHIFGIDLIETISYSIFETVWQWFLIPLIAALVLRYICERTLTKNNFEIIQSTSSIFIPILLSILITQILAANLGVLISYITIVPLILLSIFTFFTATYILSEMISNIAKFKYENHVLFSMTTAARNAPLMLAITMIALPNQPVIYAALIIGMLVELPHLIGLKMLLNKNNPDYKVVLDIV